MIMKSSERTHATYRCTRGGISLNELGWKVAHLDDVGLGRGDPKDKAIDQVVAHFRRFLSPGNMFVVPLQWGGLAEVPEMIGVLRAPDSNPHLR
jgi:hypothetical protein